MEQKAPRLSSATLVAGSLFVAFAAINGLSNLAFASGWSIEEFVSLGLAGLLFIVSFFASRERSVPELPNHPSVQEQYEAFDSTPTPYSTTASQPVEQHAAVHQPSELDSLAALNVTATLMAAAAPSSITTSPQPAVQQVGVQQPPESDVLAALNVTAALMAAASPTSAPISSPAPSSESITSALDSLTSGAHGAAAAEQAALHPPPHVHTDQGRQFTQSVGSLASTHTRMPLANIPLPSAGSPVNDRQEPNVSNTLPSMPDLGDLLPPPSAQPQPAAASLPALPDLPSIDDLLIASPAEAPVAVMTPDLPNLDGLF